MTFNLFFANRLSCNSFLTMFAKIFGKKKKEKTNLKFNTSTLSDEHAFFIIEWMYRQAKCDFKTWPSALNGPINEYLPRMPEFVIGQKIDCVDLKYMHMWYTCQVIEIKQIGEECPVSGEYSYHYQKLLNRFQR